MGLAMRGCERMSVLVGLGFLFAVVNAYAAAGAVRLAGPETVGGMRNVVYTLTVGPSGLQGTLDINGLAPSTADVTLTLAPTTCCTPAGSGCQAVTVFGRTDGEERSSAIGSAVGWRFGLSAEQDLVASNTWCDLRLSAGSGVPSQFRLYLNNSVAERPAPTRSASLSGTVSCPAGTFVVVYLGNPSCQQNCTIDQTFVNDGVNRPSCVQVDCAKKYASKPVYDPVTQLCIATTATDCLLNCNTPSGSSGGGVLVAGPSANQTVSAPNCHHGTPTADNSSCVCDLGYQTAAGQDFSKYQWCTVVAVVNANPSGSGSNGSSYVVTQAASNSTSTAAILGGALGGSAFLCCTCGCCWYWRRRRARARESEDEERERPRRKKRGKKDGKKGEKKERKRRGSESDGEEPPAPSPGPSSPSSGTAMLSPPVSPPGQWNVPPQMMYPPYGDPRFSMGGFPRHSVMGGPTPLMPMMGGTAYPGYPQQPVGTVMGPSGEVYLEQNPYLVQDFRMGAPSVIGGMRASGASVFPGDMRASGASVFPGDMRTSGAGVFPGDMRASVMGLPPGGMRASGGSVFPGGGAYPIQMGLNMYEPYRG
ncbi:hypothetical protein KFL_004260030 [Klebsormidium nitens]|uniref:Uncharacterized protein n=1 Tax=Klebsormidium nitens TaxID=105231 RepID=A0A1Y1IBX4_KLENI|nr:hypothetical protein KFL_004260030 [Klebsormidium nitens]|eukprot:GAQ88410.1 hypothetical protein KFL_004260030 [Klebsormidium nitens]